MPRAQVGRCRVLRRRAVKGRWRLRGGRGGGRQDAGPVGGQEGVDDPGWGGQPSWVVGALGGPGSGAVQALRARCVLSVRRFVVRSCIDSCPLACWSEVNIMSCACAALASRRGLNSNYTKPANRAEKTPLGRGTGQH